MYLRSCGLPGQCFKLIHRTLDRWAGEKDSIIGNGWERVGEAVGGLFDDSYLPELSDKYYNDDGVSVAGIQGPRHRSRFSISVVVCNKMAYYKTLCFGFKSRSVTIIFSHLQV